MNYKIRYINYKIRHKIKKDLILIYFSVNM